jgi:la-related protein 4
MLTTDVDFIIRIMSKSQNVTVDTTRMAMKPSWKLQRNTLILRDVPSDAPEEEVKQLFASRPVTSVHSDIGDTWFVTFATEDDALDALMNIHTISFRDKVLSTISIMQNPFIQVSAIDINFYFYSL